MAGWSEDNVAANGINIHYHRTGGDKPAMLLLHGITDYGLCWTRVALDLQDRCDVIMTDARGHGGSDGVATGFSVPILAADAAGVIRALGLIRPVVFGHSMGAITAAALAAEYPELVSAIVLEEPPLRDSITPPPADFMQALQAEFRSYRAMSPEERTARGAALNPGWDPLEVEPWAQAKTQVTSGLMAHLGSFDKYPWRETLQRIQCPGLLITGDPARGSIVTPEIAREAVELWPNGQVARIAGAGHNIHRDRYEETMAKVNAFLEAQKV
jgi:N-formylmaleamate deformylase